MRWKIIIYSSLVYIMIGACSQKAEVKKYKASIDEMQELALTDLFSKIEAVPLQTENAPLLAGVDKHEFYKDKVYLLDQKQRAIFVFDTNGKFCLELKRVGKGVGEYPLITDFEINQFEHCIDVMTCYGEVYSYDLNGRFLSMYKLPVDVLAIHNFANYSKDTVIFYVSLKGDRILYYSKSAAKILIKEHPHPDYSISFVDHPFYRFGNQLMLNETFGPTRYKVTTNGLVSAFTIDFGNHNFSIDQIEAYGADKLLKEIIEGTFARIANFWTVEDEKYINAGFRYKTKPYVVLIDKNSGNVRVMGKLKDGVFFPFEPTFVNNELWIVKPAINLHLSLNSSVKKSFKISNMDSIDLYSNPVLIKYKLKSDL